EIIARDARLIGQHDGLPTRLIDQSHGLSRETVEPELFGRGNMPVILIQRSIAVEKYSVIGHRGWKKSGRGDKGTNISLSPCLLVLFYCCLACASASWITISTRRFIWRPAAVVLVAIGLVLPKPRVALTRSGLTPATVR